MLREIITPKEASFTMRLPDEMVGKTVEVIAFEIDQISPPKRPQDIEKSKKIETIDKALSKHRVDLTAFKFDRDEANDYD